MTVTDATAPFSGKPIFRGVMREILSRFRGPGGYYNIGNLIGLFTGLALQMTTAATSGFTGTEVVLAYFVGNPASVTLTIATIIFLVAGETYHRAWQGTNAPDPGLNRFADLLSAAGGLGLSISLIYLGQPLLAILTGVLIVLGKTGSGVFSDAPKVVPFWPSDWPDPFRSMVLLGRLPAMAAAGLELWSQLGSGMLGASVIQPAVMVLCHLLWLRADVLLFQDSGATARPQHT